MKGPVVREILSWVVCIGLAICVALLINSFIIINATIPSESMEPTISVGNRIFGNRLSYLNSKPRRGDIIIFKYPVDEAQGTTTLYIKRIIGLPGDNVKIHNQDVYINDIILDEPYAKYTLNSESDDIDEYTVPEDCYFVLGDNRDFSEDSRYWRYKAKEAGLVETSEEGMSYSFVPKDFILGKAGLRYFPVNKFGFVK